MSIKKILLSAVVCLLAAQPLTAQRLTLPTGVFYYQPAASVFGSEALWINPAALARFQSAGFQFIGDISDDHTLHNWGSAITRQSMGFAYRKGEFGGEDVKEYLLAGGFKFGKNLNFGLSYHSFKDGIEEYNNRHLWDVGFMGFMGKYISWAAVFSNLNHSIDYGEKTETEMRYSLSYRPLNNKFTISADMFLSTKTSLSDADYIFHAEYTPIPGLYVNGYITDDKDFQLGVRANVLKYFFGTKSSFTKKVNHQRTTLFIGATDLRQPTLVKEPGKRLSMSISGRPSENPVKPMLGKKPISFLEQILDIYRAADDPAINEMVLSLNRLKLGFAQGQELRQALKYFRSKGKTVVCHLAYPNNISYYIASASDKIILPPVSQLNLVGLRAELSFYGGTLDKFGVKADLMRIGDHKTAPETYTETESSEANKEQINRLLDDLYRQFVFDIADGRKISEDSVRSIIDNGPYTSKEALEFGVVDGLSYRDKLDDTFLKKTAEIKYRRYHNDTLLNDGWPKLPELAVVAASGEVVNSENSFGLFSKSSDVTPPKMNKVFNQIKRDNNIKGAVLRINSPGGDALAGEDVHHAVTKIIGIKPLVVSMSNVAASGGYYIATPSSHIFALPSTITGSIGIYGGKVDLSGLYNKLNLNKELYLRGKYSGMMSSTRPFNDEEREKYFSHMSSMYNHFVHLVSESRNLNIDSVDNISRGRVWTGAEAKSNGLVDQMGGLKQSLDFLADRMGIKEYRVKVLPNKKSLFSFPAQRTLTSMMALLKSNSESVTPIDLILPQTREGIFTRLPYDIEIE